MHAFLHLPAGLLIAFLHVALRILGVLLRGFRHLLHRLLGTLPAVFAGERIEELGDLFPAFSRLTLDETDQLIGISLRLPELVVGELALFLLNAPPNLVPTAFQLIARNHFGLLLKFFPQIR